MAAIDFPPPTSPGQQFTAVGLTWTWDGFKWTAATTTIGLADAPNDGQIYGRQYYSGSMSWRVVGGSAPVNEAPTNGTTYARNNGIWVHLTHSDITDWTATINAALAPYAFASTVPTPSATPPAVNGTQAIGSLTTSFALADHVHPTDTSRYSALNPSGYVNTSQAAAAAPVQSFNTRTGSITLSSADVTTALGFTPYNNTNPSNYITAAALAPYALTSSVPVVTTTTPAMNGAAIIGSTGKWADGGHIHPTDTSGNVTVDCGTF